MFGPLQFPADRRIETKDLVLRPITLDDLEAYYALCSDKEVMRTWGTKPHERREDTRALIEFLDKAFAVRTMIRWAITVKGNDTLVGDIGFWRFVPERLRAEAGAKLAKPFWSGGYMTQALTALIEFGFERMGLNSVEANVDPNNRGAMRLVEKVGFTREGLLRKHSYDGIHGRFIDTALFSVIKGEWRSAHPAAAPAEH